MLPFRARVLFLVGALLLGPAASLRLGLPPRHVAPPSDEEDSDSSEAEEDEEPAQEFEEEDEDIPHWIVITGEDNGILTVNNPIDEDSSKSHRPIHFEDLYTNVEMYQETTLITVGKKALDKELVPEPELSTKYLEYVR